MFGVRGPPATTLPLVTTNYEALVLDLIDRTEKAVQDVARLASDTGITFTAEDVVDSVERGLPERYPQPSQEGAKTRRDIIGAMAQDILSGAIYE